MKYFRACVGSFLVILNNTVDGPSIMVKINSHSKRSRVITCIKETPFIIYLLGDGAASVQRQLVYIHVCINVFVECAKSPVVISTK